MIDWNNFDPNDLDLADLIGEVGELTVKLGAHAAAKASCEEEFEAVIKTHLQGMEDHFRLGATAYKAMDFVKETGE